MISAFNASIRPFLSAADGSAIRMSVIGVGLLAAAIGVAHVSIGIFAVLVAAVALAAAVATARWPRAMLVLVVLAPLLDRFLIARLMPSEVAGLTQFSSEGLLVVEGIVIGVIGIREGRLRHALWVPSSIALGGFIAVAVISGVLNGGSLTVSAIGLVYTVDAIGLFYLCRVVGYDHRQATASIVAISVGVGMLALVAAGQALLDPNLFGLAVVSGNFGETLRIGSLVRDPNILGTLIGLVVPFALFGAVRAPERRLRWWLTGAALLMAVVLLLTYSRGTWLGIVVGAGGVMLLLDRRVLLFSVALGIVALAIATVMPRNLLVVRGPGASAEAPRFDVVDTTVDRIGAVGEGLDLRTLFVNNALPILADHPLIGVGPGRYGGAEAYESRTPVYDRYDTWTLLKSQRTVDNFWLHILIETGILGAIALIALIVVNCVTLVRSALLSSGSRYVIIAGILAGIATVSVATGTTMLLEGNTVAFMFWFMLGIGSTYGAEERAVTAPSPAR